MNEPAKATKLVKIEWTETQDHSIIAEVPIDFDVDDYGQVFDLPTTLADVSSDNTFQGCQREIDLVADYPNYYRDAEDLRDMERW